MHTALFVLTATALFLNYVLWTMAHPQIIRDAKDEPYLVRYFIWKPDWLAKLKIDPKKCGRIYLHHILRSDYDRALHDHPWSFVSVMLKGGYWEHRPSGADRDGNIKSRRTWYQAPAILRRPAPSIHRLELPEGKTCWTLVFVGPKKREWGFWTRMLEWCSWKRYDYINGICAEPEEIRNELYKEIA